jgi:type II secretion system protein L
MSDLIILTSTDPASPWNWGLPGTGKWGRAETSEEKSALADLSYSRLVAVVPGMNIVTKLHALEGLKEKQKFQAAGFSIEDELAASLDDTHIAFDPNASRLAVCSNSVMTGINASFRDHGLNPDLICADYDSFGDEASFEYEGRIISRSGSGLGFAIESSLASAVLNKDQGIPATITAQSLLEKIAKSLMAGHMPINLKQGHYARKSSLGSSKFKRLSMLAAGVVVAFLALNIGQGLYTGNKTKAVEKEIDQIYAQIFPDNPISSNPAQDVYRATRALGGARTTDFVSLSALMAKSVQDVEGVEISSLRYDAAKGQLNLSILYGSFEDTEKLKAAVERNGGIFTEGGTRQSGKGLSGDAVLSGGTS